MAISNILTNMTKSTKHILRNLAGQFLMKDKLWILYRLSRSGTVAMTGAWDVPTGQATQRCVVPEPSLGGIKPLEHKHVNYIKRSETCNTQTTCNPGVTILLCYVYVMYFLCICYVYVIIPYNTKHDMLHNHDPWKIPCVFKISRCIKSIASAPVQKVKTGRHPWPAHDQTLPSSWLMKVGFLTLKLWTSRILYSSFASSVPSWSSWEKWPEGQALPGCKMRNSKANILHSWEVETVVRV